jgi:hypothetical protein
VSEESAELDPTEEAIRSEPPSTLAEAGEHVNAYIEKLNAIAKTHANDPLKATEESLCLAMRLVARLSPAGSSGPAYLFRPPLEVILALGMGASPDETRRSLPHISQADLYEPSRSYFKSDIVLKMADTRLVLRISGKRSKFALYISNVSRFLDPLYKEDKSKAIGRS